MPKDEKVCSYMNGSWAGQQINNCSIIFLIVLYCGNYKISTEIILRLSQCTHQNTIFPVCYTDFTGAEKCMDKDSKRIKQRWESLLFVQISLIA